MSWLCALALSAPPAHGGATSDLSTESTWAVDAARDDTLRRERPAVGTVATWIASGRQTMDLMAVEVSSRQLVELEITRGPRGGRTWQSRASPIEAVGLSDFGPIAQDLLEQQVQARELTWRTGRDGAVTTTDLSGLGLGEALQTVVGGMGAALQVPARPKRLVPGESWTEENTVTIPFDTEGIVGVLALETRTDATFLGWVADGAEWLAWLDVRSEIEVTAEAQTDVAMMRLGGVGRSASQLLLVPATGLPRWQVVRTRVTLSTGDRRPDVIEETMVLSAVAPPGGPEGK